MNKLTIIGNLTRDPESRVVSSGKTVCNFTVAVNRRRSSQNNGQSEADFFRVAAWGVTGENCQKYLTKGRKVCVVGQVSANAYLNQTTNAPQASLEVFAEEVEFLSSRNDGGSNYSDGQSSYAAPAASAVPAATAAAYKPADSGNFQEVEDEELPF